MANVTNEPINDPYFTHVYDWTKYGVSTFLSIAVLLGIPGNTIVILVHTKIRDKNVSDWMIFYIALCDILSLFVLPLLVVLFNGFWALYFFPNFLCKLLYFNLQTLSISAYLFCACTALERFYKVVHSKNLFSIKAAKCLWIPIFIVSSVCASPTLWAVNNNANGHCMHDASMRHLAEITYVCVVLVAILASSCMVVCYVCIGIFLLRKMKDKIKSNLNSTFAKSNKNTIKTTKMLAVVTTVFLFSANVPGIASTIHATNMSNKEPYMTITFVLGTAFVINMFFNPIIYLAMSSTFRQKSLVILQSCFWSRHIGPGETSSIECRKEGSLSTKKNTL